VGQGECYLVRSTFLRQCLVRKPVRMERFHAREQLRREDFGDSRIVQHLSIFVFPFQSHSDLNGTNPNNNKLETERLRPTHNQKLAKG
jgi:hypothetical protein